MFKVYLSDSVYDRIIKAEEQRAMAGRSSLYKLLKQQPVHLLNQEDMGKLKAHPENVLKNPSSLYILDVPAAEALAIQRTYGVMCLSSGAIDISPLIDVNAEHTTEKKVPLGRGWDSVLDSVEYHFNSIAKRLNDIALEFKKPYEIVTEVLGLSCGKDVYYKFHNRRIVSNYFVVKMDYSLAAFNKTEGTSEQTIIPQVLFTEDSLNKRSSAPLLSLQQITKALRSFSLSLTSSAMDHNSYSYAVNGKRMERCMTIRNGLIK